MENSLVSFCIPVHNGEKYIQDTLKCICGQSYRQLEIIVVNDGSTDGTVSEISKIKDDRIKLIETKNAGAAGARNIAYQHTSGEYIIFFDADDHIGPDFVQRQVSAINGQNDIVVMAAWGRFYNDDISSFRMVELPEKHEMTFTDWVDNYWYNCNPMTNPGRAFIPRKLVDKAGPWNEKLSLNDDLEFFTRIFVNARSIIINSKAVFYYRSGIGGLSGVKGEKAFMSLYNSIHYSVQYALQHCGHSKQLLQGCANMLQSFIYIVYPQHMELVKKADEEIKRLAVKPAFPFPASGVTRAFSSLIGWKLTQQFKHAIGSKR